MSTVSISTVYLGREVENSLVRGRGNDRADRKADDNQGRRIGWYEQSIDGVSRRQRMQVSEAVDESRQHWFAGTIPWIVAQRVEGREGGGERRGRGSEAMEGEITEWLGTDTRLVS